MISLSDQQFRIVMSGARAIDPEWRHIFLQRVWAMLELRDRFADSDVVEITKLTLAGLLMPEWIPPDPLSDF
jgi:hypothetical protein